ncbi:MAG: restriction endonuclease subunit S [Bacteroidota bacterium]
MPSLAENNATTTPPKPNFKHTELGWIPKDWEVKKLGETVNNTLLGGNYKNISKPTGIPLIKMGNIDRGKINTNIKYVIAKSEHNNLNPKHKLKRGDILFNTRNTLELVGKVCIWDNEYSLAYFNSNILKLDFDKKKIGSRRFANFVLNSHLSIKQLKSFATGTTSVAAIYDRDIKKLKLKLPPLPEQQAIADCLSTWDEAIEKQQQLIYAKQQQHNGLRQLLLTGKKRLTNPETGKAFDGEWMEKRLGEYFSERKETKLNNLPLLSIGENGVYPQSESNKKDTSNKNKDKYKRICPNDIGYNTMRLWQGRSALSNLEGIVSPAYTILKPTAKANSLFFSYLFKLNKIIHRFYRNSQGMVSDTLNCKYKDFSVIKLRLPNLQEQTAIAEVLETSSNEIQLLQKQLHQLQLQKKGLMQVLLSGEKRLNYE